MDLRIAGLEQVQRALKELPAKVVVRSYAKALDRAAGVIAADVMARAEGLPESGSDTRLSEHVITKVEVDTNKQGGVAAVGFDHSQDQRTGKPMDVIALQVEFGHRMLTHERKQAGIGRVGDSKLDQSGRVKMHPFVRPAYEATKDKAVEVFGETLIDGLSEIGE